MQASSNAFAIPRASRLPRVPNSGKVTGSVIAGNARIVTESEESTAASTALAKKYGVMLPLTKTAWRLFHLKGKAEEVYIAIEPIAG